MGGSVYFAIVIAIFFLVLAFVWTPFLLIPGAIVVLVALFSAPLLAAISQGGRGRQGAVPTTGEASYDPVAEPQDRRI